MSLEVTMSSQSLTTAEVGNVLSIFFSSWLASISFLKKYNFLNSLPYF